MKQHFCVARTRMKAASIELEIDEVVRVPGNSYEIAFTLNSNAGVDWNVVEEKKQYEKKRKSEAGVEKYWAEQVKRIEAQK